MIGLLEVPSNLYTGEMKGITIFVHFYLKNGIQVFENDL